MSNLIRDSIIFYLISINVINCFNSVVFLEEYCDVHENELFKMEKECFPLLQIEVSWIMILFLFFEFIY